ncbi:CPBP family intramembrane glutamic endopeptidase [Ectobacillus ponti]|uniref:CPBP family intramembrane metalloprotease n=1 Tax=Ectobacillus ponti TaxID=2961894 RepID=A0AA42BPG6_9BACI|nr:CPBP family intramembrane glutamic endopeptidase [Ectobacillus ponti]MCP8968727.1 CPBP family intramembrane metalloprotease [Ectobacillus ponti]
MSRKKTLDEFTDRELRLNLYMTQAIILGVSLILGLILFQSAAEWRRLWRLDWEPVLLLGGGAAVLVVALDYMAMKLLPEAWFDDGGINERMFRGLSIPHLLLLTFIIGFAEELLFRGILQTHLGLWLSSLIFAALHLRYVAKPFLFAFVLSISMLFGWLFAWTDNLLVTVFAHFLVDFIMGLHLRESEGEHKGGE